MLCLSQDLLCWLPTLKLCSTFLFLALQGTNAIQIDCGNNQQAVQNALQEAVDIAQYAYLRTVAYNSPSNELGFYDMRVTYHTTTTYFSTLAQNGPFRVLPNAQEIQNTLTGE